MKRRKNAGIKTLVPRAGSAGGRKGSKKRSKKRTKGKDNDDASPFAYEPTEDVTELFESFYREFNNGQIPSWDYFEAAAEDDMPRYRLELAKSGRSSCKVTNRSAL